MIARIDVLLDEYRASLQASLEGLTDDEARLRVVPSNTTLLGLVKHACFVEAVWFEQAITGRSLAALGVAASPARSFALTPANTITSVQAAYRERCEHSRRNLAGLTPDAVVDGRGRHPVWAPRLQVLRELAQHAGHADILREQILSRRAG